MNFGSPPITHDSQARSVTAIYEVFSRLDDFAAAIAATLQLPVVSRMKNKHSNPSFQKTPTMF